MAEEIPGTPEQQGQEEADLSPEIQKYSEMLAQDPKSRAFALLAEAYRKSGRYDEAIKTAEQGLENHPHYLSGRVAMARALFDGGSMGQAREEFEKVIATAPDNLMAHRHLAEIYSQEGRYPEAAKSLKMVVLLDPNDTESRAKLDSLSGDEPAPPKEEGPGDEMVIDRHRYEEPHPGTPSEEESSVPIDFTPMTDQEMLQEPDLTDNGGIEEFGMKEMGEPEQEEAPPETPEEGDIQVMAEPVVEGEFTEEPPPVPEAPPVPEEIPPVPEPPITAEPAVPVQKEHDTETMAEILIQQGSYDKALEIYEKLLVTRSEDADLRVKHEELKRLIEASAAAPAVEEISDEMPKAEGSPDLSPKEAEALKTLRQWLANLNKEPD